MQIFTQNFSLISMIVLSLILWIFKLSYQTKIIILSVFSLIIVGLLHPLFVVVVLLVLFLVYGLANRFSEDKLSAKSFLTISFAVILLVLICGKYGNELLYALFKTDNLWGINVLAPIGISYFVIKIIQLILDIRRGLITKLRFFDLLAFLVFLPTFSAGPIESYASFKKAYIVDFTKEDYFYGIRRILLGYFKKFVITDVLIGAYIFPAYNTSFAFGIPWLQSLKLPVFVILVFTNAYFDLSAYTDIAIGFSRLFGFKISENFNRPFWKRNIGEFWRSWHMTLSNWCTTNVYFPVFGATKKVWIGLYASMLVMGLWHYVSLTWLFWGLHHATGLVLFNVFTKYKKKRPKLKAFFSKKPVIFISHLLTFWYVALGYAFVSASTLREGLSRYMQAILGPLHAVYDWALLLYHAIT